MAQRPATVLNPAKIDLLRKALTVSPMTLDLTGLSMFPFVRAGDRCRVQAVEHDSIQVGDVILATRESRLFAHRVVAIRPGPPKQWIIKGDTLLFPDPPVLAGDIMGQLTGIVRGGKTIDLLTPGHRRKGRWMAAVSGPYSQLFLWGLVTRRRVKARTARFAMVRSRRRAAAGAMTVRPATDEDIPPIAMLFAEQQIRGHAKRVGIDMDLMHTHARAMLYGARAAGATMWVVEMDGFVGGHAVIGPLGADSPGTPGWWVMSVYVKMTGRGRGAAEAMVRAGLDEAAAKGVPEVRYAAFETNGASIALAEKCGFSTDNSEEARTFAAHYTGMGANTARLLVLKAETGAAEPTAAPGAE